MRQQIKQALILGYKGEIARANANIEVYMREPVGIGEHPDIIAAIDSEIEKAAHAQEKLEYVEDLVD
tara:strand:- start:335 stop:535 length:201 start_codon:yes stop_codon:yes gene_type:complete